MIQFVVIALCVVGGAVAQLSPECIKGPDTTKSSCDCCKIPEIISKEVFGKCAAANPKPQGPPKGCCMSECVMNETRIMVNGKLDKAAAVKFITEKMGSDTESLKVATAAIEQCEKDSNPLKAEFDKLAATAAPGEKVCNMISGYIMGCMHAQILKNCPKDKLVAEAECGKVKEHATKCGFLPPPQKM